MIENYWNETESYEALRQYVDWNFDGLNVIYLDTARRSDGFSALNFAS